MSNPMIKKHLGVIAKIVTILSFPFIVFALFSGRNQTKLLKTQVSISNIISFLELSDQAIRWRDPDHGGRRASYESLLFWEKEIEDPKVRKDISLEIKKIKKIYKDSNGVMNYIVRHSAAIGSNDGKGFQPPTGYDAKIVFKHLSDSLWIERARAARLLKDIESAQYEDEIDRVNLYDSLINLMKKENESSLCVSKMALNAYASLMSYKIKDVFDFEGAFKHWEQNRKEATDNWEKRKKEILEKKNKP